MHGGYCEFGSRQVKSENANAVNNYADNKDFWYKQYWNEQNAMNDPRPKRKMNAIGITISSKKKRKKISETNIGQ